jgi:hypothetical protein
MLLHAVSNIDLNNKINFKHGFAIGINAFKISLRIVTIASQALPLIS